MFFYEYTVKDHLGNARVNFQANGAAIANIEDHDYYPFGMKMEGIGSSMVTNKYTYNYKELNEDFGLNWHDYGARCFIEQQQALVVGQVEVAYCGNQNRG